MLTVVLAVTEPSKVPFYICGGLLVVWAVVVAAVGLTRPAFPFTPLGQRAVMGLSVLLAALAIGTAIATSR